MNQVFSFSPITLPQMYGFLAPITVKIMSAEALHPTVLQIQVYPKNNAPRVSKPPRVAKSDFLLILKIFSNLDDIQHSN